MIFPSPGCFSSTSSDSRPLRFPALSVPSVPSCKNYFRLGLPALALLLAAAAPLSAQVSTRVSADAPIVNFRLPTFTDGGHRAWLVRGSEARLISSKEIDVTELTMTVFTGDATERITTMLLSPLARLLPEEQVVFGPGAIRVIDDEFEASGEDWRYDHREKRVSIKKNVRVAFRAQLRNLLQ